VDNVSPYVQCVKESATASTEATRPTAVSSSIDTIEIDAIETESGKNGTETSLRENVM